MSYYLTKTVDSTFEDTLKQTAAAPKEQWFGVLTESDVRETIAT
jgi:uncharacterized protein (DUF302 family)